MYVYIYNIYIYIYILLEFFTGRNVLNIKCKL